MPKTKPKKSEEEIPFKVGEHHLVPKHELLDPSAGEEIAKRFNAKPGQFPFILSTDPAAKAIGAKPGDFIRITRKSETAGQSVYYRYVVEA